MSWKPSTIMEVRTAGARRDEPEGHRDGRRRRQKEGWGLESGGRGEGVV